jgi:hypothetical protein
MRRTCLILIAMFASLGAQRAHAQQASGIGHAQVTIIARLTIPDMLVLSAVPATQSARVDGAYRQLDGALTLYVSANRNWRLVMEGRSEAELAWRAGSTSERVRSASAEFVGADSQREVAQGRSGTSLPIRVDYRWASNTSSTQVPPVVYSLTAS